MFDLSNTQEYSPFIEYNSLHDPHLKSYFYRPGMKRKLIANKFVTDDLRVLCTLKEYNAYRSFLEREFMKLRREEKDKREDERRRESSRAGRASAHCAVDQEREKKRREFFRHQERELKQKQLQLKKMKREEEIIKMQRLDKRRMERERMEVKREAEREQRRLDRLRLEQEEMCKRATLLRESENHELVRQLHLQRHKQEERMRHLHDIDARWQKYEEHARQAKEEERQRREEQKMEREKRLQRRERLFKILQQREEERKKKQIEENHREVEMLKQQADELERQWRDKKDSEIKDWKRKTSKQRVVWDHQVELQAERRKKEAERHTEELLLHSHPPTCASGGTKACPSNTRSHLSNSTSSKMASGKKSVGPSVRFKSVPTVHVLGETGDEDEEEGDSALEGESCTPTGERDQMSVDTFVSTEMTSIDKETTSESRAPGVEVADGSNTEASAASPKPGTPSSDADSRLSKTPSGISLQSTASSVVEAVIAAAVDRVNSTSPATS